MTLIFLGIFVNDKLKNIVGQATNNGINKLVIKSGELVIKKQNKMKKIIAVAVIGFVLSSCRQTPYYKVEIHYYPFSKQDKRTIELIKLNSKDDTAAFEESVRTYWMYKLLSEGYNDNKEADYPLGNVPYFFFTYKYIGADSSAVDFDSSIATKLAKPIIEDVRKTVIEILKKEKQEKLKMDSSKHGPADIY